MSRDNKNEGSCSLGGCNECFARLGAELGFPDADYDFYDGLKQLTQSQLVTEDSDTITLSGNGTSESPLIAELADDVVTSIVTNDTATIILSGDGSDEDPLEASLAQGAITSLDGTVNVTQFSNGVVDLSVGQSVVSTNDTPTVVLSGDGTTNVPLEASFAPTALTSTGGTLSVVQQPDGTFNLEAVGVGSAVVHEDTNSVVLIGDGTPGVPLTAQLAPTAITSVDSTVTIAPGVEGAVDLSVSDIPITTADSDSVVLNGNGTTGTPLEAQLAPTAIASSDSSIAVTQGAGGAFDITTSVNTTSNTSIALSGDGTVATPLEAEIASTALASAGGTIDVTYSPGGTFNLETVPIAAPITIESPDSSITVTEPVVVGDPYELVAASTFTDSASIEVNGTPGTAVTPPDYSFLLASTALTSVDGSVSLTYGAGGVFDLSVAAVTGVIPRTVVVGGTIGATPSAATLAAAIALIPTPIIAPNRWTLLICPGSYIANVTIPSNVNLIALIKGTVRITDTLTFSPLVGESSYTDIVGITSTSDIIINSTTTADPCQYTFTDCIRIAIIATTKLAGVAAIEDVIIVQDSVLRFFELTGTMMMRGSINKGITVVNAGSVLQVTNSTLTTNATINGFTSLLGCVIGGNWSIIGSARCLINSCKISAYSAIVPSPDAIPFILTNNSASAYVSIRNTDIVHRVTRGLGSTWTVTSPNIAVGTGGVDREIDFTLLSVGNSIIQPQLTVNLQVPLITTPWGTQAAPGQQSPVTAIQVSGSGNFMGLSSAVIPSISTITISNTSASIDSNAVSVSVRPPADESVGWYSPTIGL